MKTKQPVNVLIALWTCFLGVPLKVPLGIKTLQRTKTWKCDGKYASKKKSLLWYLNLIYIMSDE